MNTIRAEFLPGLAPPLPIRSSSDFIPDSAGSQWRQQKLIVGDNGQWSDAKTEFLNSTTGRKWLFERNTTTDMNGQSHTVQTAL